MKKWIIGIGIATLTVLSIASIAFVQASKQPVVVEVSPPTVSELHELVNVERAKVGAKPLILDERLNQSAQLKADELAREGWDNDPHGRSDGKRGYTYIADTAPGLCTLGSENLTNNTVENTSMKAINAWVISPPHHQAMINKDFDLTGFGINGTIVVEHFCDLVE